MMSADLPPPPPAIHQLAPCPDRPNCVSSLAEEASRRVEPLPLVGSGEESLARLREVVEEMRGATVDEVADGRLAARFRSRVFGFVDDLELVVDEAEGVVHVRSASRFGYSDMGANRKRVESIRRRYEASTGQ